MKQLIGLYKCHPESSCSLETAAVNSCPEWWTKRISKLRDFLRRSEPTKNRKQTLRLPWNHVSQHWHSPSAVHSYGGEDLYPPPLCTELPATAPGSTTRQIRAALLSHQKMELMRLGNSQGCIYYLKFCIAALCSEKWFLHLSYPCLSSVQWDHAGWATTYKSEHETRVCFLKGSIAARKECSSSQHRRKRLWDTHWNSNALRDIIEFSLIPFQSTIFTSAMKYKTLTREGGFILARFWNTAPAIALSFLSQQSYSRRAQKDNQLELLELLLPLSIYCFAIIKHP